MGASWCTNMSHSETIHQDFKHIESVFTINEFILSNCTTSESLNATAILAFDWLLIS